MCTCWLSDISEHHIQEKKKENKNENLKEQEQVFEMWKHIYNILGYLQPPLLSFPGH